MATSVIGMLQQEDNEEKNKVIGLKGGKKKPNQNKPQIRHTPVVREVTTERENEEDRGSLPRDEGGLGSPLTRAVCEPHTSAWRLRSIIEHTNPWEKVRLAIHGGECL